jgi:3-dehydroquinate dehydratase/shikimate dehydrogenase
MAASRLCLFVFQIKMSFMLVASVTSLKELDEAMRLADLVELRLDHFSLLSKPNCSCIFTLRKKSQGGALDLSEGERLFLLERYLQMEPEYCDIEADTDPFWIEKMARRYPKTRWIGSYHDFQKTPSDLNALLLSMKNPHFSIYKIAVKANSTSDMLRLMIFLRDSDLPLSAISLGEYGKPSRVLGKVFGNLLSYAGLQEDFVLGRYSLSQLHEIFRFHKLHKNSEIYALIGDPVEQSIGHIFHNREFRKDAVYVKMRVDQTELEEFFALAQELNFAGFSVTMPLKEAIVKCVEDLDGLGVVNTVFGRFGFNTDGIAALDVIERREMIHGKKIAVLGAGGTAKAIVAEARKRGAEVAVFNRTVERAKALGNGYSLDQISEYNYDILINTIPGSIALENMCEGKKLALDVIYHPKETLLLQQALQLGWQCVYGEEMFYRQAELQQEIWR